MYSHYLRLIIINFIREIDIQIDRTQKLDFLFKLNGMIELLYQNEVSKWFLIYPWLPCPSNSLKTDFFASAFLE